MNTLKDYGRVRSYKKDSMFDISSTLYIVIQGKVIVLDTKENRMVSLIGHGEYFDDTLLISEGHAELAYIAFTEVIVLPISKAQLPTFIAAEPTFAAELMREMSDHFNVLKKTYEELSNTKYSMYGAFEETSEEVNHTTEVVSQPEITENPEQQTSILHNDFNLFPSGHKGDYTLALTNNNENICELEYKCPLCGEKFKGVKILNSRLGASTVDNDMRRHYKDIDTSYYDVVTCTHCLYSALESTFYKADNIDSGLIDNLEQYKNSISLKFGKNIDTESVFAAYYIALYCAPKCFQKYQLIEAKLLQKLSWLYHDCGDEKMEMELTKQSLEKHAEAYSRMTLSPEAEAQLCNILAELNLKMGNIKEARTFYYNVKTNSSVNQVMKKKAEDRIEELKELDRATQVIDTESVAKESKPRHLLLGRHK